MFDTFRAETEGGFHRFLHHPPERDPALELTGDRNGDQLCIQLGTLDLLDIDVDLAARRLAQVVSQLVDFGALATDDDARARGIDRHPQTVSGTLDIDLADSGVGQSSLEPATKAEILVEVARIVA